MKHVIGRYCCQKAGAIENPGLGLSVYWGDAGGKKLHNESGESKPHEVCLFCGGVLTHSLMQWRIRYIQQQRVRRMERKTPCLQETTS